MPGHCIAVPEIAAGIEGAPWPTTTGKLFEAPSPQSFTPVTVIVALPVFPEVTVILLVPIPEVIFQSEGTVHSYEVALEITGTEYIKPVMEGQTVAGPVIVPAADG
jgi:hypothetical protein